MKEKSYLEKKLSKTIFKYALIASHDDPKSIAEVIANGYSTI